MAYTAFEEYQNDTSHGNADPGLTQRYDASAMDKIELPDDSYVRDADMARDGMNLVISTDDGKVVIEGYFAQATPPSITSPGGLHLSPQLVHSFAHSAPEYADATHSMNDASPVGAVQEIKGEATVTRTDGTTEHIGLGTPIYAGDIIETDEHGAVNIMFMDETTFAISNDARLAIDEYVFDPSTQSGETNFSVLKGVFVFTSGLIGRDDPDDVHIDTPSGSIGIRGTIIAGNVDTGEITVVEGAIVLTNFDGHSITLANQYETAQFNTLSGTIDYIGDLSAHDISSKFSDVSSVAPDLFASIQDSAHDKPAHDGSATTSGSEDSSQQSADGSESGKTDGPHTDAGDTSNTGDGGIITSSDITLAGHDTITTSTQINTTTQTGLTNTTLDTQPLATADAPPPPPPSDNIDRPPFTVHVDSFTIQENTNSGDIVALIKGEFSQSMNLVLSGPSNNFFTVNQIDPLTYEVHLKNGVTLDAEHPYPLSFSAKNDSGALVIAQQIDLHIGQDASEHASYTQHMPDDALNSTTSSDYFSASNNNHWQYNFAQDFEDPGHQIAKYQINASGFPSEASVNFDNDTGHMSVDVSGVSTGTSFTFTIDALDANGNTISSSSSYTFDLVGNDIIIPSGSDYIITGSQTFTGVGDTDESVILSANNASAYTGNGDDTVKFFTGNYNLAHMGDGNDTLIASNGSGLTAFGDGGNDSFDLSVLNTNKFYGGDGSDKFTLNATNLLGGASTGSVIDGGAGFDVLHDNYGENINFTAIDDSIVKNIEQLDVNNGSANTVTLSYSDVVAMTDDHNTLVIDMDNNDTLTFSNNGSSVNGFSTNLYNVGHTDSGYSVMTDGVITLLVSDEGTKSGLPV